MPPPFGPLARSRRTPIAQFHVGLALTMPGARVAPIEPAVRCQGWLRIAARSELDEVTRCANVRRLPVKRKVSVMRGDKWLSAFAGRGRLSV
jgi:hypothetical protein